MRKAFTMFLMILLPIAMVIASSCSSSSDPKPDPVKEALIKAVVGEYNCTVGEASETVKMTITAGSKNSVNISLPKVFDVKTLVYTDLAINGAEVGGTVASVNVLYKGDATATVAPVYASAAPIQALVSGVVTAGKVNFTIKITDGATVRTIKIVNKISKEALVNAVVGNYNTSVGGGNETVVVSIVKGAEDQVNITLPKVFVDGVVAYENFKIVGVNVDDPVTAVKMSFLGKALAGAGAGTEVQTEVSGTIAEGQIDLTLKIGEGAEAKTVKVVNKISKEALVNAVIGDYNTSVGGGNETVVVSIVKGAEDQVNITLPKVFIDGAVAYENFKIVGVNVDDPVTAVKMSFLGKALAGAGAGTEVQTEVSGTIAGDQINLSIKIGEGAQAKTVQVVNKVAKTELVDAVIGEYESTTGSLEPVMVSVVKGPEDQVNITLPKVFVDGTVAYENFKIVGVDVDNPVTAVKMSFKGEATADGGKKAQTEVSGTIAEGQIDLTIKIGEGATAKTVLVKNKVYLIEEITTNTIGSYTSLINGVVQTFEENGDVAEEVPLEDNPATVVLTPSAGQTSKVDFDLQGFEFSGLAIPVNLTEVALVKEGEKGAKIDHVGKTNVNIGMEVEVDITVKGTVVDGVMDLDLTIDVMEGAIKGTIKIKGNKVVA